MPDKDMGESEPVDSSTENEKHAEHTVAQHEHGVDCGHDAVTHDDHVDFEHGNHRHFRHDDHYDEH